MAPKQGPKRTHVKYGKLCSRLDGSSLEPLQEGPENDDFEGFYGGLCRNIVTGNWCYGTNAFDVCNSMTCVINPELVSAEPAKFIDSSSRSIDQQLIYNGKVDNSIRFTYREFTGTGMARDAFTQDVQYDLGEGAVIGFKGARLEILEATNRQIKYRVLAE